MQRPGAAEGRWEGGGRDGAGMPQCVGQGEEEERERDITWARMHGTRCPERQ